MTPNIKHFSLPLIVAAALSLNACASMSTMQTAGVVPQGETRWAIAATGTGADGEHIAASAEPNFAVAVRHGVAENVDVGLKLDFLGIQAGAKYQVLKGDFDLSVGIEADYHWLKSKDTGGDPDDPSTHLASFQVPILMEYHVNPFVGIAFGPKLAAVLPLKTDKRADIWHDKSFLVGLMAGLPLRLTEGAWFQPEFNIYTNAYDSSKRHFTNVLWQAGVSVFFGGL